MEIFRWISETLIRHGQTDSITDRDKSGIGRGYDNRSFQHMRRSTVPSSSNLPDTGSDKTEGRATNSLTVSFAWDRNKDGNTES
jgi:hypothetical protein